MYIYYRTNTMEHTSKLKKILKSRSETSSEKTQVLPIAQGQTKTLLTSNGEPKEKGRMNGYWNDLTLQLFIFDTLY